MMGAGESADATVASGRGELGRLLERYFTPAGGPTYAQERARFLVSLDARLGEAGERLERLTAEIAAAERTLGPGAVTAGEIEPAPVSVPAEQPEPRLLVGAHLLFVPSPGGYALLERSGLAPEKGNALILEDAGDFLVSKVGRSPLPGDARSCAYLQQTG